MNREHIKFLIDDFQHQKEHFEEVFNTKVNIDIDDKESLANFINLCVKNGWDNHVFYTIVLLHFISI